MTAQELITLVRQMIRENRTQKALGYIHTTPITGEPTLSEYNTLNFFCGFCQFKLNQHENAFCTLSSLRFSPENFNALHIILQQQAHYALGMLFLKKTDFTNAISEFKNIAYLEPTTITIIRSKILLAQTYLRVNAFPAKLVIELLGTLAIPELDIPLQIQCHLILWLATAKQPYMLNALALLNDNPFSSQDSDLKAEGYSRYINALVTMTDPNLELIKELCKCMEQYIHFLAPEKQIIYYTKLFQFEASLISKHLFPDIDKSTNHYLSQFPTCSDTTICHPAKSCSPETTSPPRSKSPFA